jgi:hypothetical protein
LFVCFSSFFLGEGGAQAEVGAAIALLARVAATAAAAKLEATAKAQADADLNMGVVSPLSGKTPRSTTARAQRFHLEWPSSFALYVVASRFIACHLVFYWGVGMLYIICLGRYV